MIAMLIPCAGIVGLVVIPCTILLYIVCFFIPTRKRTRRARRVEDVLTFKRGAVGRDLCWALNSPGYQQATVAAAVGELERLGASISRHEEHQAEAYFGSRMEANRTGIAHLVVFKLPLRVVVRTITDSDGTVTFVRMDEDYGMERFEGPGSKRVLDRYIEAFDGVTNRMEAALAPFGRQIVKKDYPGTVAPKS
jgi:hypothetical protein